MQIVSLGDNLHEMSKPAFWEKKKNIISLSFAECTQTVVKVNMDGFKESKYCNDG